MDIGAAGALILFFSVFVALMLVALVVFAYAAYSFLLVLSNTAVGNDEVVWPGEPIPDWFFKGWYLGWLLAVWVVPSGFLASLFGLPKPQFALCVVACLWLLFPLGLLSSLSAESRMVVFRPVMVRLLMKHFGTTLSFYASSGFVVLIWGVVAYAALFGPPYRGLDIPLIWLPLAAVISAASGLIYARLLGRTAFIMSQSSSELQSVTGEESREVEKPQPVRTEPRGKAGPKKNKLRGRRPVRAFDPWAVPADEPARKTKPTASSAPLPQDPYGPAEGTYDVMAKDAFAPPSKPTSKYSALEPEEVEPYILSTPVDKPPSKLPPRDTPEVSKLEEELAAPRLLPPLPDWPLVTGVYSFPCYPHTVRPLIVLICGLFGVFGLIRLLLFMAPF